MEPFEAQVKRIGSIPQEARKLYAMTECGVYSKQAFDEQLKMLFLAIELENQCQASQITNQMSLPKCLLKATPDQAKPAPSPHS